MNQFSKAFAVVASVSILLCALSGCASPNQVVVGPCKVTDKTATGDKDGNTKYLVYTDECGVLTVEDAIILGAFNSSDTYASIKKGETYSFSTYGFRNGFISSYPNIISVVKDSVSVK